MKRNRTDRHRLKIGGGSMEFFSFPGFLIFFGAMMFWYEIFPSGNSVRSIHWAWPTGFIAVGVALCVVQYRKLRFKTLGTPSDLDAFKAEVRKIMAESEWDIKHDNKRFMQALYGGRHELIHSLDMVTFRFRGGTVLYNIVNDPDESRSGLAALFSRCKHGKRLINELKKRLTAAK